MVVRSQKNVFVYAWICVFVCTCSIWHRSEEQSMFSHGWYIPRVTQFNKITIILTRSNHVETLTVKENRVTQNNIQEPLTFHSQILVSLIL